MEIKEGYLWSAIVNGEKKYLITETRSLNTDTEIWKDAGQNDEGTWVVRNNEYVSSVETIETVDERAVDYNKKEHYIILSGTPISIGDYGYNYLVLDTDYEQWSRDAIFNEEMFKLLITITLRNTGSSDIILNGWNEFRNYLMENDPTGVARDVSLTPNTTEDGRVIECHYLLP